MRGIIFLVITIYLLPIFLLAIIYIRLIFFMHNQTLQFSQTQPGIHAHRDLVVIRRIIFTIVAMTLPGLPNIGFIFLSNIHLNMEGSYEMYRIQWTGPILAFLALSVALMLMTPPLKALILSKMSNQRAQVQPATLVTPEHYQTA